jgi:phosphopantothenoylcysteine decarboxylase / phosphopantothenate---cysteine ligase
MDPAPRNRLSVLVTAGPTREPIDPVRFITSASSGKMGYAVAEAAAAAGHDVTLLSGPVALTAPAGVTVVPFVTVADLKSALDDRFDHCDVLVMAAAVGDYTVAHPAAVKLRRSAGAVTLELIPTDDLLAAVAARRRGGQLLIGFTVADVDPDAVAREKLTAKGLDYIVVNTPAAMAADISRAAILSPDGVVLPWERRTKRQLAEAIAALIARRDA